MLEFRLNVGGEMVPVVIKIRTYPWPAIRAFRIDIAGTVVYSEGRWPKPD